MFRRRTLRVELHHVPSGTVAVHEHTPESLARKVEQARSIARDARRADLDFGEKGEASELFPPATGPAVRVVRPAGALPRGAGGRPREVRLGGAGGAGPRSVGGSRATTRDRHPLGRRVPRRARVSAVCATFGRHGPAHLVRDPGRARPRPVALVLRRRAGLVARARRAGGGADVRRGRAARALALGPRGVRGGGRRRRSSTGDGVRADDAGPQRGDPGRGPRRARARRARRARPVSGPVEREWGGFTGYFADPDGFRWEVAWNPGPIGLRVVPDTDVDARP